MRYPHHSPSQPGLSAGHEAAGTPAANRAQPARPREFPSARTRGSWLPTMLCAAACLWPVRLPAELVIWDVDHTNSYIRLTIPDQTLAVPDLGNVTVRMRDANSTTQWTDAGGRRAALDGELLTDYVDGVSISFRGGAHNLYAIEGTNLRPNPADWSAATTNYTGTRTAPAALGGRVRGTYTILTFDAAFIAFRSVRLDITNTAPGPIPLASGSFASETTRSGIASALLDVDGLELPLGLGQPIPDLLNAQLDPVVETNAAGGVITNLGGLNRKLTYTISIPNLSLDLSGTLITGSVAGLVVAYATLPEPPPPPVLGVAKQGENVILSWSTNAAGFMLETSPVLPAQNWSPASPPPVVRGSQYVVTNAPVGDVLFYRLRKP